MIKHRGRAVEDWQASYGLTVAFDLISEHESEPLARELLDRLRNAGFCACETVFGCIACKATK